MSDYKVHYGENSIAFSVMHRKPLKNKVSIHVQPDGRVIIDSPPNTPLQKIKQALLKRARWVSLQITKAENQQRYALPRLYVSGETHWYLGKRYLLKVIPLKYQVPSTKLKRGFLTVIIPEKNKELVQEQLDNWYLNKAQEVFSRKLEAIYLDLTWVKHKPDFQLRAMNKQWGSCSPKGKISLNPLLVKAPSECIDYVILHELCHLKHHNHGEKFYQLLKRKLPQWESIKCRLDGLSEQILNK
ncbi:MAG: metal-dependent hydrolase [SAR86 cluster bacterium]|uniref:Metal-dependent hydrolase n=1 Tax=SAR86 cluster bacterium TaxID=2030880 RepID=A0A2A5CII5_9GAMM|nr:MAG: metal-dependent hydrolase [SAR86 cluster bacterium]